MSTMKGATNLPKQHESNQQNNYRDRVVLIRSVRWLTILLGKLGVNGLYNEYPPPRGSMIPRIYFGFGLKDCKDYTEKYMDKVNWTWRKNV